MLRISGRSPFTDFVESPDYPEVREAIIATHSGDWGLKHPLMAEHLDRWEKANLHPIVVMRSPLVWAHRIKRDVFPAKWTIDRLLKEWLRVYEPLSQLDCPVILFSGEDIERSITAAFRFYGLTYRGGYDGSKVHVRDEDNVLDGHVGRVWETLKDGACRTNQPAH